jgi:hypothetical protein
MNAIPGRCNKPDSTQAGRRAQTPNPPARVGRRRPLPFCKEPLAEPRSELLAALSRVTPGRVPLQGQQWEGLWAGSAVGTKGYDKLIKKPMQRRRPVLEETHTCERCRPVYTGAVIRLIDA